MTGRQFFFIYFSVVLLLFASCKRGNTRLADNDEQQIPLAYAKFLKLSNGGRYTRATVINPWDSTKILAEYILVPDSIAEDTELPDGTVVRYPLKNALVYSSIHADLISEFGEGRRIGGVCDSEYIYTPELKKRLAEGRLDNCGQSMAPDVERIIRLHPDGILMSPYENSSAFEKIERLGVPLIQCADYMEVSPLAQAEWMRFYGLLFGQSAMADSVFRSTEEEYNSLKTKAAAADFRPKVLLDLPYGASWNVPTGNSTMGIMLQDAGGENLFGDIPGNGSKPLTVEQVYMKSKDADIWLVRYNQLNKKDATELAAENPLFSKFAPYIQNQVYGCNTRYERLFEDRAFHPQKVLGNLCMLFHPELFSGMDSENYFEKMKR